MAGNNNYLLIVEELHNNQRLFALTLSFNFIYVYWHKKLQKYTPLTIHVSAHKFGI